MRFIVALAIRQRYRLEVLGFKNIPETGGVLMLGNRINPRDWAFIQIASPRSVRFVMDRDIPQKWYLRKFLDLLGVVPISGAADKSATRTITDLINAGEVVCPWPEETPTSYAWLAAFQHGDGTMAEAVDGVVLPFSLINSAAAGSSGNENEPGLETGGKRNVTITFDKPLPL